jgi:hypothetical protein
MSIKLFLKKRRRRKAIFLVKKKKGFRDTTVNRLSTVAFPTSSRS